MLYEALAGKPPFAAAELPAQLHHIFNEEPPAIASLRPDVPADLRQVVEGCLKKDRDARLGSGEEVLATLGLSTDMRQAMPAAGKPAGKSSRWGWIAAGVVVVAVAAGARVAASQTGRPTLVILAVVLIVLVIAAVSGPPRATRPAVALAALGVFLLAVPEVLYVVDGMELFSPFHFEPHLSMFSITNSRAIQNLDVSTGGFSAVHGDRMSGVLSIELREPEKPSLRVRNTLPM